MNETLYDVLAVNIETSVVRVIDRNKTERNAEAIVNMAVMRRGVDVEFFTTAPAGKYRGGETCQAGSAPEVAQPENPYCARCHRATMFETNDDGEFVSVCCAASPQPVESPDAP